MKLYEKPRLMVLSFTVNDALCSNCSIQTRFNGGISSFFLNIYGDKNNDGIFGPGDVGELFGTEESCTETVSGYEAYCKFSGSNQLFTS